MSQKKLNHSFNQFYKFVPHFYDFLGRVPKQLCRSTYRLGQTCVGQRNRVLPIDGVKIFEIPRRERAILWEFRLGPIKSG